MGTPRCELIQTFSQAVHIPQDPFPKGSQTHDRPFLPSRPLPSPCPQKQQQTEHDTAYETCLRKVQDPIFSVFCFLSSRGSHSSLSHPHHAAIQPPVAGTAGHAICPLAYDKHEPVQLRSRTESRRNAIYNRTCRLSLGPKACTAPFRPGFARLCMICTVIDYMSCHYFFWLAYAGNGRMSV